MQRANMALVSAAANQNAHQKAVSGPSHAKSVETTTSGKSSAPKSKLSSNESRELESLPAQIDKLDAERALMQQALADPSIYQDAKQSNKRKTLQARADQIEAELAATMQRWEILEAKRDATDAG